MLQTVREKTTGWVAIVILAILVVPFAFFGVENYFQQQVPTYVAKVNDVQIGQDQFRQRFEDYRNRMRQMLGDQYDAAMFDNPVVKRQVLDSLVDEEVLRQFSTKNGLVVSPAALQKEIAAIDAFKVNGVFDPQQYRLVLTGAGMTPRSFEDRMANDLLTRMLPSRIAESGVVTDQYIQNYLGLRDQKRSFNYVLLPAASDASVGDLDEALVTAYYEANKSLYLTPETVSIEYIELNASNLTVDESADEATLRQRYEENKMRYMDPEQRLVSHILIQTPANADAAAVQAAQQKASEIASKARESGSDFAVLAQENSEDPGSRASGGDLGWIERGVTDAAFEEALFAMDVGISDPVKGADGWHIIQLREIKPESGKSFEDVRSELEAEYLESARERAYSDVSGRLVDAIYRDPSTLENAAQELNVAIATAGPFTRTNGTGVFANPEVQAAMFSDSVMVEGLVSDLIEYEPGRGIALRVTEHVPAATRPLEEVRAMVEAAVRAERIDELGKEALAKALESISSKEDLVAYAEANELEVREAEEVGRFGATVDPAVSTAAFALAHPAEDQSVIGSAHLGAGVNAVIALTKVLPADAASIDEAQKIMLKSQLGQAFGTIESTELVKSLRKNAKIDIVESRM